MRIQTLLLGLFLASPALAQLKPGTHLVCAAGSSSNRGIFVVDRHANTQSAMTIKGISWSFAAPVRTFVEDAKNFLMLVRQGSGQVYRVSWSGTAWNAKKLNTTGIATGEVPWAMTRIGAWIYVTASTGGSSSTRGRIFRIAAQGGAPAVYLPIGSTYRGSFAGMPTAVAAVGSVLHIFLWDTTSRTAPKHLWVDTAAKTPKLAGFPKWPLGKARTCKTLPVLPTQAHYDPHTKLLVIGARLGDLLWRTVSGVTVRHVIVVKMGCNPPRNTWGQSMGFDSDTGRILYGTAARQMDEALCPEGSWQRNVTQIGVSSLTPINGIEYVPSGSLYRQGTPGCAQSNGKRPCNHATGLPMPGNRRFGIGVQTTSRAGFLILGAKTLRVGLGGIGAPGCTLGVSPVLVLPATATSTGLHIGLPLPSSLRKGAPIYTQWVLADRVNKLGLIVSDVRRMLP